MYDEPDEHQDIRAAVRQLCQRFPDAYRYYLEALAYRVHGQASFGAGQAEIERAPAEGAFPSTADASCVGRARVGCGLDGRCRGRQRRRGRTAN